MKSKQNNGSRRINRDEGDPKESASGSLLSIVDEITSVRTFINRGGRHPIGPQIRFGGIGAERCGCYAEFIETGFV